MESRSSDRDQISKQGTCFVSLCWGQTVETEDPKHRSKDLEVATSIDQLVGTRSGEIYPILSGWDQYSSYPEGDLPITCLAMGREIHKEEVGIL